MVAARLWAKQKNLDRKSQHAKNATRPLAEDTFMERQIKGISNHIANGPLKWKSGAIQDNRYVFSHLMYFS